MRVPSDTPPLLPPRVESPTLLTEAVGPDAAGWQDAADALDAVTPAPADEGDHAQDHEEEDGRKGLHWAEPEEEDDASPLDHEAARRPDLGNGFWVLPELRSLLPRVHTHSRSPLIAEPSRALSTDLPGQRHARQGLDDGDEDGRQDEDAEQDNGRSAG